MRQLIRPVLLTTAIWLSVVPPSAATAQPSYDPLATTRDARGPVSDLSAHDPKRKREIPLRIYRPAARGPRPVVLFSHGLGGNREGNAFMGEHWSARGYVVVALQHPGSDDAVWRDVRPLRRMAAMRKAASPENLLLRTQDVAAALDQLSAWNTQAGHPLAGSMDLSRVAMTGHSFGALTTQAVSGQTMPLVGNREVDRRIRVAIAFSPGAPARGDPRSAFAAVSIPWLLMTGTEDGSPIGGQTPESRRKVFEALPHGDKYELVLWNAEHSAFTDRALPGDKQERNPNHHRAILALSTAFLDAYLVHDSAASDWLRGNGPSGVLQPRDVWRSK